MRKYVDDGKVTDFQVEEHGRNTRVTQELAEKIGRDRHVDHPAASACAARISSGPHSCTGIVASSLIDRFVCARAPARFPPAFFASQREKIRSSERSGDHALSQRGFASAFP